ncbi:MAG: HEAT repeat domain-containing protein [Spirochaetales bacterium]|nr:HEAT repeat domain-containing protein [Spirochaetales bacterium]
MRLKTHIILVLLLVTLFPLMAQDNDDRELTVEERYLQDPEIMVLWEQALASDRQSKLNALETMEEMVEEGRGSEELENILIHLGLEGSSIRKLEGRSLVNNFPEVRKRACALLGKVGTEKVVQTLISILTYDDEPMVKAEAAYALGLIGKDENGNVVNAMAWAIEREGTINPDNNFAYAIALSLEKIAEANKGLTNAAGYRALIRIAQGNYLQTVREKALEIIKSMKKYN